MDRYGAGGFLSGDSVALGCVNAVHLGADLVGVDAVDGQHDTQRQHGIAVVGNADFVAIAPAQNFLVDRGDRCIAAAHFVVVVNKIAVNVPVAVGGLQRIVGAKQRDVGMKRHFLAVGGFQGVLGGEREHFFVDVHHFLTIEIFHCQFVAPRQKFAFDLIQRIAVDVLDSE